MIKFDLCPVICGQENEINCPTIYQSHNDILYDPSEKEKWF
jgi:hypothetical protein